ncbi:homoserine dehydrogenase [Gulosibacter molinativorax]|uniref:Homoserine dehydrogenase n=1 Tax=Gulosibacter molinativorax TaxID=256821 RepID=A0ABT7C5B9_9MICO|nr:homoserine dehydrogenase [Gulosibacter molinativorax]MDJ1369886.1 homoserine dehydrogenase [Gulosibacter molinativorax]QUY61851.1 Homoserine dehydrogenase [Gulosibacter molinativorax]
MNEKRAIKVALLGAGSVGSQVARLLLEQADEYERRVGTRLELIGISVRNPDAKRDVDLPKELFTTDAETLIVSADIVVELMGGINPARELVTLALESGADVVTANKALLAHHGAELFELAERVGAQLYYEAAVGGAIPIIRPLRENLGGDRVERILGIVNGTTNYILDRMHTRGDSFDESLRIATELGYAEADPTADIEGYDAQQKASILASIAFHTKVPVDSVYREGITKVSIDEIEDAKRAGYVVKLLAICERIPGNNGEKDQVSARVYPALVPETHPLASVHGGNNAIFVEAKAAGSLMFYGAGAGGVETASAVLGDLVAAARRHLLGGPGSGESMDADLPILPVEEIVTSYQISLEAEDEAGILAGIAQTFAEKQVSVATLEQAAPVEESDDGDAESRATLVIGTHRATEGALSSLVTALAESPAVHDIKGVLRVEGSNL